VTRWCREGTAAAPLDPRAPRAARLRAPKPRAAGRTPAPHAPREPPPSPRTAHPIPPQARHVILEPDFSGAAADLRAVFDSRFEDPRKTSRERFLWDYWHVENQYTLHRTQAGRARDQGGGRGVARRSAAVGAPPAALAWGGLQPLAPGPPPPARARPETPAASCNRAGRPPPPQAAAYFPKPLYRRLESDLLAYGERNLGCRSISPIWMSL
jgi:hypothetical protein